MQKIVTVLFLIFFHLGFSQLQFDSMPENAKEIHFTYKQTSKILVNETGVYADSVLFKVHFPNLKYLKVLNPEIPYLNTVISLNKFKGDERAKLISMLYHENETYSGTFFVKKNETIIKALRDNENVKKLFKKYFNESYSPFSYSIILNHTKKSKRINYPRVVYDFTFDEIKKEVKWFSPTEGTFVEVGQTVQNTNMALFDENLSYKIAFDYIFTNSTKGLLKVESIENILELVEVNYK